jgi:RNA recognition motif-containing protein
MANSKILLGNLSTDAIEDQIREVFSATTGSVCAVSIPTDPRTGKGRGYAFVEMNTDAEAQKAVDDLNGHSINGRKIAMSLVEGKPTKRKWYQFNAG